MESCKHLDDLLPPEGEGINFEIDLHKWYLSERYGYDVGRIFAELDYLQHYLPAYAKGFKDCYCKLVCKDNQNCEIYQSYLIIMEINGRNKRK